MPDPVNLDELRAKIANLFRQRHQNVCYPDCGDDAAADFADDVLALVASPTPSPPSQADVEGVARAMIIVNAGEVEQWWLLERERANDLAEQVEYLNKRLLAETEARDELTRAALSALPAPVGDGWQAESAKLNRRIVDGQYMIGALVNMLGPTALKVWQAWCDKGVLRVHYSWGPGAANLTGEERAAVLLEWDEACKRGTLIENVDELFEEPFEQREISEIIKGLRPLPAPPASTAMEEEE